ncbi:hypothetical protein L1987_78626 [Smallanthus sonchifolius]|uniref:Uncharacterized protein n=1 Tax=Smallanthus sonchifolius TaxID=185202 RepID=A0ACB8ZCX3_9ASTR|nr:hypothetical protein L1987_78626 [Smallanthus sonchifolius]
MTSNEMEDEEETLVALIEHRTKEVEHLRTRVAYYKSMLDESVNKLEETQSKLARLRSRGRVLAAIENADEEEEDCKIIKTKKRKPLLVIPKISPFGKTTEEEENEDVLIEMVCCSSSSACKISCETSSHIPSQHKRKLRNLVLCPTNHQLFVTSALDGIVNLWQATGSSHANLVNSINAASLKQRRWPEDIAWHPHGGSLISVYSADCGDSQLAILNLNDKGEEVVFLEDKPHVKGVINNVMFMPWGDNCFTTCGNDHAVVLWTEKPNSWKPKLLHASLHSSAVMGVAGMKQKRMVVSVGADKRIIGFDLQSQTPDYKHQIESKCMSVVPNPRDLNLFMVQTGTPQRQLRLFDMRLKVTQVHEFGWDQESSTSQSALINQAWSPDGFYLTSGSADPMIHIFDIRFNGNQPSLSIKAHQKRVFKAAWHKSLPLLISISSDLNIGFHNIT